MFKKATFSGKSVPSVYSLRTLSESAARAAYHWIGRGATGEGDRAAVHAMINEMDQLPFSCNVVVGDGVDENGRTLNPGSTFGTGDEQAAFDLAVDPLEGMSYLARGMTNALAAVALAPSGALFDPGSALYMEKLVVPPLARGKIDPSMSISEKLQALSKVLKKQVSDLTVFILEKPRHKQMVQQIHQLGARVALYPAGDIAGALMASIADSGIDALMGTGGCREGIISACAVRALGGDMFARLDPQLATEKANVAADGLDLTQWNERDELVKSKDILFCATGIMTGLLFKGVEQNGSVESTESLLISGIGDMAGNMERQLLTTYHNLAEAA